MDLRRPVGQNYIKCGTAGCLLEKAFCSTSLYEKDGPLYTEAVKVLRSSHPPISSSFSKATILQLPVSRDHFDTPCSEKKRESCPLQLGQISLVEQKRRSGFMLFDEVLRGYRAWIIEHVIDGVAVFAEEMMKAAKKAALGKGWRPLDRRLEDIRWLEIDALETHYGMKDLIRGVHHILASETKAPAEFVERWNERLRFSGDLLHDVTAFPTARNFYLYDLGRHIKRRNFVSAMEVLDELKRGNMETLDSLVKLAVSFTERSAKDEHVDVIIGLMPELRISRSARFPLIRILSELLTNAIKYSDERKEKKLVKIVVTNSSPEWLKLHVMDNGVGIEDVDAVQELWYREQSELASGFGIGLASVRNIAQQQGWKFNVRSIKDRGTTMTLSLRLKGYEELIQGHSLKNHGDESEFDQQASSLPPGSRIVTIPPPPALPHDLLGTGISGIVKPVSEVILNPVTPSTSLSGASYLLLSIPVPAFPRALCG